MIAATALLLCSAVAQDGSAAILWSTDLAAARARAAAEHRPLLVLFRCEA